MISKLFVSFLAESSQKNAKVSSKDKLHMNFQSGAVRKRSRRVHESQRRRKTAIHYLTFASRASEFNVCTRYLEAKVRLMSNQRTHKTLIDGRTGLIERLSLF